MRARNDLTAALAEAEAPVWTAARRDGCLTPEILTGPGRVHSLYRSSVNLLLENGCFCTLLAPVEDDGPGGIILKNPMDFTQPRWGLEAGLPVTADGGRLTLGRCQILTAAAQPFSSRLVPSPAAITLREARMGLSQLKKLLAETAPPAYDEALAELLRRRTGDLCAALLDNSVSAVPLVGRLVGLGIGLTPSGDDWLAGCLAALLYAGGGGDPRVKSLQEGIGRHLDQTPFVSGQILRFALQGRFRGELRRLTACLFTENGRDAREPFQALLRVGASSGYDMAQGVLSACGILCGCQPETIREITK